MGASSSKVAAKAPQAAAAAGRRQYPSTSSILNSATSTSNAPSYAAKTPAETNVQSEQNRPPAPSQVYPDPEQSPPSSTKSQHIDLDGRDPQFSTALRQLGPAVPINDTTSQSSSAFPTSSTPPPAQQGRNIFPSASSSSNPSLRIVQARDRIAQQYERESENLGRGSFGGRTLISAREISDIIRQRAAGKSEKEIEKAMRLGDGVVGQLEAGKVVNNV